jgi:hypothetical protein
MQTANTRSLQQFILLYSFFALAAALAVGIMDACNIAEAKKQPLTKTNTVDLSNTSVA